MSPSTNRLESALLERAWSQWIALGVDAVGEGDPGVVDPEALIALTAELGDTDARLRDVSTDWCLAYGRYINGARLKQVVRELGTPLAAIGEYVATVAAHGGPRWPLGTHPRPGYTPRGKARLDSTPSTARLRIRLRAAFGVNARADVLAALLATPRSGLSIADLARATRFTKPSTAFAVDALVLAGLIDARTIGNERRLVLADGVEILSGLRAPIPQQDWVARFGVALEALRFDRQFGRAPTVRAVQARGLIDGLGPRITTGDLPKPNLGVLGAEFSGAFDRWVGDLATVIAKPR